MKLKKIIIALNLFLITFSVSAYDAIGHRIIADIAYQHLSKKAKKQCDKLLGQKGLVYEAPWADEVKSDKSYDYSYDWHFQNLKDSMTTDDLKALLENPTSEGEHLFYAIKTMTERLKSNQSDAEALKFLVHLVGDLHQPMHLGRSDDKGGNRVEMNWFGQKTNIHAVWDSQITASKFMSYSEFSSYLQNKFKPKENAFKNYSILQSVEAVYAVRNSIYAYDMKNTNNYHYVYRFADDLDEMLFRGGMQLANVLNGIF